MLCVPVNNFSVMSGQFPVLVDCTITKQWISNSFTMGCPPVRGDNPRALASGLSDVQVENIV